MKHRRKLERVYGDTHPKRISSRQMARLSVPEIEVNPHDEDCCGKGKPKWAKDLRCWKRYRKQQYRQAA
jgi:hypothetical protein